MGQKLKTEYYVRTMNGLRLSKTLTRTYCGNYIYEDGNLSQVLFDGGYITFNGSGAEYHYYIQDHLGRSTSRKDGAFIVQRRKNVSSVVKANANGTGTEQQVTHYYPFGGIIADLSTGTSVQNKLYNGKELDTSNNLWWYDYGARHYDPTAPRFTTPDPIAEKYYGWNMYGYCMNTPINAIDPNGMETHVVRNPDGTYGVIDGELNDDRNIYVMHKDKNGDYTIKGASIGLTSSVTSFYDSDNKTWAKGSVINPKDNSGKTFLENIEKNTPSLMEYIPNARNNQLYDF